LWIVFCFLIKKRARQKGFDNRPITVVAIARIAECALLREQQADTALCWWVIVGVGLSSGISTLSAEIKPPALARFR
jgi:hypothetical protein